MTQVILVETDKHLTPILRANLFKKFGWEVIVKDSSSEAISLLQILTSIDLIIARENIGKDTTAKKIGDYLITHKKDFEKEIPLLILGKNAHTYPLASLIDEASDWNQIMNKAGSLLGLVEYVPEPEKPKIIVPISPPVELKPEARPEPAAPEETYRALSAKFFLNLGSHRIPFDAFSRTKKKDKGFEYVLKYAKEIEIDRSEIERLVVRGMSEFFVPDDQFAAALSFVKLTLLDKLKDNSLQGLDRVQLSSDVFEITRDLINSKEFGEFTYQLISENIKGVTTLTKAPNVFALFNNGLKINKLSYGFSHCFLTCILISKILPRFEWASEELQMNVAFMSYFHDLTLGNDKLIKAHHHYFKESKNLSPEESIIVTQHALLASDVAAKCKNVSTETIAMIKEHHGIKSGKGFSESLSIIISPLAMCFLTVEEFVTRYLDFAETTPEHLKQIFLEMDKKFNKLTYAETLKALQEIYK